MITIMEKQHVHITFQSLLCTMSTCPYHISDILDSPQFRFTDSPKEIKKSPQQGQAKIPNPLQEAGTRGQGHHTRLLPDAGRPHQPHTAHVGQRPGAGAQGNQPSAAGRLTRRHDAPPAFGIFTHLKATYNVN